MIFDEVFLQSQNDDCLGQVLSFLTCQDLANAGRTCKVLKHTIFETDHEESNVDLIWQGAEEALTNPSDKQQIYKQRRARAGAHAREHCHLYAAASKAAKAYERMDGIEENRIKVDGVLADLMNVRGFDAESIAEKKAIAANETPTLEEAFTDVMLKILRIQEVQESVREKELERKENREKLAQLTEPTKSYHHDIFVRITSSATGEMISEGFCDCFQSLPWFEGLEVSLESRGLQIALDFESLRLSEEMQDYVGSLSTPGGQDPSRCRPGIILTAVVIDKRNHAIQCLFQHDQTQAMGSLFIGPDRGGYRGFSKCSYEIRPKWVSSDLIQLGPSISQDLYYLGFSLSFVVAWREVDKSWVVFPLLEVNISNPDWDIARQIDAHFGARSG